MKMEEINLVDLDELVLSCISQKLDAPSLAKLTCTCKELRTIAEGQQLWRDLCLRRWKRRNTGLWTSLSTSGDFRSLYAQKHQVRLLN